ncbi:MAG: asparagine synthetase B [Desulfomonile tiedjei]|uniref:asparagine synthase (glutamine-hydrolyzing) n=1 Tax=Desulfomonile tiedjei TaxID=2358 RepID=A0A9D6Z1U6_9BACT|nr:asparagine synthetase B [Desulfomonile tiedjei]
MSGIAGIFFRDNRPVNGSSIRTMLGTMEHRGPDRQATWTGGSAGLGHLMFYTTAESFHETLPLFHYGLAITADARVDNREDLVSALRIERDSDGEVSDSRIILAAYEKWERRSAARIVGDFAFCVRDELRDVVFCSRDGTGARPFYYHLSESFFAFASEIRALVALEGVPRSLNETMVADYLIGMYDDQQITFYKGIRRLPPGHNITVGRTFHRIERHWSLDPDREVHLRSDTEYADAFRDIFKESVRCRLRSAYPVVSTLSGGLDSSSVTCVSRDLLADSGEGPLQTLSMTYENVPECDERIYINAVIAQGGISPHFHPGDTAGKLPYINCAGRDHDDPFDAPNSQIEALASMGSLTDVRVGLDGVDGDTTVSHGHGYLIELVRNGRFISLFQEAALLSERLRYPLRLLLWRKAIKPQTPERVRHVWRFLTGRGERPWHRAALINRDFANRIGLKERFYGLQGHRLKPLTSSRLAHYYALTWGGVTHQIESLNKQASLHQVELRHPFRDTRLMEFCLALPPEQKLSQGWPRRLLRMAMAGILPDEVRWRTDKADFRPSFAHWALGLERNLLERAVLGSAEAFADYVDLKALNSAYKRFLIRPMDVNLFDIWSVATLGSWLSRSGLRP